MCDALEVIAEATVAAVRLDAFRHIERDVGRGALRSDTLPDLVAQLSDPDPRRRAAAADELGQAGAAAASALELLLKAAGDSAASVRASAVAALGRVAPRDTTVAAVLDRALRDPSEDVRYAAREARAAAR